MNMHVGNLPPPIPPGPRIPRRWTFTFCLLCEAPGPLELTMDRASLHCRGCGTIMPAEMIE